MSDYTQNVPPEVWSLALSLLSTLDLTRIALVSNAFLKLARSILYRSVRLDYDENATTATLDLLERDLSVCKHVKELNLTSPPTSVEDVPAWVNPGSLGRMVNLRVLHIASLPFHKAEDQQEFADMISTSCSSIEDFIFRGKAVPWAESVQFSISGLRSLTWRDDMSFKTVFSLLCNSQASLTQLSLHFRNEHTELPQILYKIRIPNLVSLTLGVFATANETATANTAMTEFLVTHSLITHLDLMFKNTKLSMHLCESTITRDMLPRLRSLHASVENITAFARIKLASLETLSSLSVIHSWTANIDESLRDMFTALHEAGNLTATVDVHYDPGIDLDSLHCWEFIARGFTAACPKLQHFTSLFPTLMSMDSAAMLCSKFTELTHMTLSEFNFAPDEGTHDDFVRAIASLCPKLEDVEVRMYASVVDSVCYGLKGGNIDSVVNNYKPQWTSYEG